MSPRRVPKLTKAQNTERWVAENYRRRLEHDRRVCDMEGWGGNGWAELVPTPAGMARATLRNEEVRLPSDAASWSPDHHKPLLNTKDGEKFYRRRAEDIRDDLRAALRNARRTFSLHLDALDDLLQEALG